MTFNFSTICTLKQCYNNSFTSNVFFFQHFSLTASNGRKNNKLSTSAIIRSAEYEFYCRLHLKFANGFILHRNIIYLFAFTLKTHPSRQLRTRLDQTFAEDHHRQGDSQPTRTLKKATSRDKLVVSFALHKKCPR